MSISNEFPILEFDPDREAFIEPSRVINYLAPAREVKANIHAVRTVQNVLNRLGVKYLEAKTWTTDAFYRETREKIDIRNRKAVWPLKWSVLLFLQ